MRGGEIAGVKGGFVSVKQREDAEHLIVERAFESGAADAVAEAVGFAPGLAQHAVKGFESKGATVLADAVLPAFEDSSGFKIG